MMDITKKTLIATVVAVVATMANINAQGGKNAALGCPQQDGTQVAVKTDGQIATLSTPLKVRLSPAPALRNALEKTAEAKTTVRLSIETVQPSLDKWSGLRVFLNAPGASAATPETAPEYVASVAFYGGTEGESKTFVLDIGRTLRRLKQAKRWKSGEPLTVTILPIPSDASPSDGAKGIEVKRVVIALPDEANAKMK
ncbi:MAG TPA: hypothetical protein VF666_16860 [Pyrinomonadaceae bacterium]